MIVCHVGAGTLAPMKVLVVLQPTETFMHVHWVTSVKRE